MSSRRSGITLIELMVVIAIIGLIAGVSLPAMLSISRRSAARAASAELRGILTLCRSRAIARANYAGVKFTTAGGQWLYALYDDGNRNGIRNADITSGVDRCFSLARPVLQQGRIVFIALPPFAIKDPDGDPLLPTASPVQFGTSAICSFSPIGEATPGTVYLSDRIEQAWAVRVTGGDGRVRLLRWNAGSKKWEAR